MPITTGGMRALRRRLCLCAVVAVVLLPALSAQDQDESAVRSPRPAARRRPSTTPTAIYTGVPGSIAGTIEDQLGDPIPGVTVRLLDETGNGLTTAATTSATFEFTGLRPGSYTLEFSEPGFARTQLDVNLDAAERAAPTVVLPIDTHEETLHITPSGARTTPVPRTELERFLATRFAAPGSSPGRSCIAGKPCVIPARKIVDRTPSYPPGAARLATEGVVSLAARITRDGFVEDIQPLVVEDDDLGAAAISAVRGWQFEPARLNGVAVDTTMTITVEFSIK